MAAARSQRMVFRRLSMGDTGALSGDGQFGVEDVFADVGLRSGKDFASEGGLRTRPL